MALGIGAGIGLGAAQGVVGLGSSIIQGEYNKKLQEKANEFTREQSKNQIKYNVQQMQDLGYSPMMLFDHGNATSGSAGSGKIGASAPNYAAGIIEGINTVGRIINENERLNVEERKIDQIQDANDHKYQFLNEQERNRNEYRKSILNNQIKTGNRQYTEEFYNGLFDKIE